MGFLKFKSNNEKNIILNNINGVMQNIAMTLISSFAGIFIKKLNASDNLVSMLNSLPAFFSVTAIILGTGFVVKCKDKKRTASILFLITRFFYLGMAAVAFLNKEYIALFFVILYGALNFTFSIGNFMWQSFFADIFKPSVRAKYLSTRSALATFAGTLTTLIAGILLSKVSNQSNFIKYYQVVFLIAFLAGLLEVASLYFHVENKNNSFSEIVTGDNPLSFKFIKLIFKQKPYMFFMICVIVFHFTWQMGWPIFLTCEVDYLHTNEMWSGIIVTVNGICTAFGYSFWRKFAEKRGNALGLSLGAVGMASTPFIYAFATHIKHVAYFTGIIGFSQAAVLLILLNTLYEVSPRENRTSYIAFYNLATNITLIIAPWVGMKLYRATSMKTTFLILGLLRIASSLLFFLRKAKTQNSKLSVTN